MDSFKTGIYYHFKNPKQLYHVIGIAHNTESEEPMVVYRPLYETEHELFVRPLLIFLEEVDRPELEYAGPRFIFVRDAQ